MKKLCTSFGDDLAIMKPNATLSTEVWLGVFRHLDYFSLKKMMRVNKAFHYLATQPSLDEKLFRGKIISEDTRISLAAIQVHPTFNNGIMYLIGKSINDVSLILPSRKIDLSPSMDFNPNYAQDVARHVAMFGRTIHDEPFLKDTNMAYEFATSPAVQIMSIKYELDPPVYVWNENGVTVLQVMEAICCYCSMPSMPKKRRWNATTTDIMRADLEEGKPVFFDGLHEDFPKSVDPWGRLQLRLAYFGR